MGYGDQMMAAGLAEDLYRSDPSAGPVAICDCAGNLRLQPLWKHNPMIGASADPRRSVRVGKGCLPYLQYPYSGTTGLRFVDPTIYRAADHRGSLFLTDAEKQFGRDVYARYGPFIAIEPSPTDRKNVNRAWPVESWQLMVGQLQRLTRLAIVQFDHPATSRLGSIPAVPSPDIRAAAGIIASAALVVSLEGGIPFIAAALRTPAVVLWGGCVSAPVLAYPEHVNLVDDSPETPCGSLAPCQHCTHAWARLSPVYVADVVYRATRSLGRQHGAA